MKTKVFMRDFNPEPKVGMIIEDEEGDRFILKACTCDPPERAWPNIHNGCGPHLYLLNSDGGWGAGFVVALSKKWKKPEQEYRHYCKNNIPRLSLVQCINVEAGIFVANMFAQDGFPSQQHPVALDYKSLTLCLAKVKDFCKSFDSVSVHMPLIGCGLAGGKWEKVGPMVEFHFENIPTYVYQLPNNSGK